MRSVNEGDIENLDSGIYQKCSKLVSCAVVAVMQEASTNGSGCFLPKVRTKPLCLPELLTYMRLPTQCMYK